MAFVYKDGRQSPHGRHKEAVPQRVGPGSYDVDGTLQKEFMAQIYPKKVAPFNQTQKREVVGQQFEPKLNVPGPGAYYAQKSEFENSFDMQTAIERNTYLQKDSQGCIQRKMQPFAQRGAKDVQQRLSVEVPGPGQYENAVSSFMPSPSQVQVQHQKSVFGKETRDGSPKHAQTDSLPKMSVPSIPSRFCTPAMDMAQKSTIGDNNDRIQSIDGFQMSRLVDDPSKVGPSTYFPIYEQTNPIPKNAIDWVNSKTERQGIPNTIITQPSVGPGCYNLHSKVNRQIQNMSIPRQGRQVRPLFMKKHREAVSIRDSFEESDSDDEDIKQRIFPGPGHYTTSTDTSFSNRYASGKLMALPVNGVDRFGTRTSRFNERAIGGQVGPGAYKTQKGIGNVSHGVLGVIASSAFKVEMRKKGFFDPVTGRPGPGDYLNDRNTLSMGCKADLFKSGIQNKKKMHGFGVNTSRFDKDDTLPPGPGQYKQADSCQIKNKGHIHYGYKSCTDRDLKFVTNKNPGVGDYNMKDHLTIGVQKIQGGAPNNFLILTKNIDPTIRRVEPKMSPRLPDPIDPTNQAVGPGSYFKNSQIYNLHQLKSANLI